jgi:hypothetical protein
MAGILSRKLTHLCFIVKKPLPTTIEGCDFNFQILLTVETVGLNQGPRLHDASFLSLQLHVDRRLHSHANYGLIVHKFVELRNLEHFKCLLIGLILGCHYVDGAVGDESNQYVQILVATLVRVNLQGVFANNEE